MFTPEPCYYYYENILRHCLTIHNLSHLIQIYSFLKTRLLYGLLGSVFHLHPSSIANKVLTDALSSAIPAMPIICTQSISFQRGSSDKNNGSDR